MASRRGAPNKKTTKVRNLFWFLSLIFFLTAQVWRCGQNRNAIDRFLSSVAIRRNNKKSDLAINERDWKIILFISAKKKSRIKKTTMAAGDKSKASSASAFIISA